MKKQLFSLMAAALTLSAAAQPATYTDGYFIVNESQYGARAGTLNFYSIATGEVYTDVYEAVTGRTLGESAEFGCVADGKIFITSKQHKSVKMDNGEYDPSTGGRLVVANATTLETMLNRLYLGEPQDADTRDVIAIPEVGRFYVGSTGGIFIYDLNSLQPLGKVENLSAGDAGVYGAGYAGFTYHEGTLYAPTQGAIDVIDVASNAAIATIELENVGSTFEVDGTVYAAVNSQTWGAPGASDTEQFIPIVNRTELGTPINVPIASAQTWFAACPCKPAVIPGTKAIVYSFAQNTNYLCKYDFATGTFTEKFITLDGRQQIYGHGIATDPVTGDILVPTFQGYASTNYWFNVYSSEGVLKRSVKLPGRYWFPSQVLIGEKTTDVYPASITLAAEGSDDAHVQVGKTLQLTATVAPEGAAQGVKWSSSDSEIATIDENGLVTPVQQPATIIVRRAPGEDEQSQQVTITATSVANATVTASIVVTIDPAVTAINNVESAAQVQSVTYVNAQGMTATQPFAGVNIVVTRLTDGTVKTTKVVY